MMNIQLTIVFTSALRYWKSLQNLLGSLINSIEAIISLLVLLFLFLGIFALLGTQLFGAKFSERKGPWKGVRKPPANFDTFHESFYAVFQVRWRRDTLWKHDPRPSTALFPCS